MLGQTGHQVFDPGRAGPKAWCRPAGGCSKGRQLSPQKVAWGRAGVEKAAGLKGEDEYRVGARTGHLASGREK